MTSPREDRYAAMVALLCGELGEPERRDLEEFMASDLEASQHFAELSQTLQAVQQIQVPTAPANLADRLLDRLAPRRGPRGRDPPKCPTRPSPPRSRCSAARRSGPPIAMRLGAPAMVGGLAP